jgi:hypothetical protein
MKTIASVAPSVSRRPGCEYKMCAKEPCRETRVPASAMDAIPHSLLDDATSTKVGGADKRDVIKRDHVRRT